MVHATIGLEAGEVRKSRKAFFEEMVQDMARILEQGVARCKAPGWASMAQACLMELGERNIRDGRALAALERGEKG